MQQISVSPVFVGRGSEITELTDALRRAGSGSPQAVLIGGEAGVGKTRLLEEFLKRAGDGGAVTTLGGCLEIGAEGLPYAPLAGALRRLHRSLGAELEAAAAGSEGHLARLLPEFGEADGEPNDEYGRARLFEHTARLFERLGAERTLVFAVEDLHWSDRSTRELLAFLVRTLHRSRVLLVATYRSDDLHRRHPLRPFLAELERLRTVQRLELERFGRGEVAAQLAGILGTADPDRKLVDRIHRRSEGNPFFVEELATAFEDGCGAGLTDSLRDILLVRVETLDEEAQRVVRIAAEGGSHVEHALLAAVLDDDEEALIEALRAAVGANILRPDSDGEGYRFRHALVREAVSDDLLPGERHRINRKFALAVEAQPHLVSCDALPARLANYWYHAHDPARALPTALDAARAARRRNAFAEQLGMLERALELWDMVSEEVLAHTLRPYDWAETYPPGSCDHSTADEDCDRIQLIDVLAEAVVAARRCGDRERGLSLARRGLRLVDETVHPVRAAWFRINRARMLGNLRRSGDDEEILYAHRLVDHLPPSAVQAEVFALGAGVAMLKKPGPEHLGLAERAIRIAQEVGAHSVEVHARMTLGGLRYDVQGDAEGGLAELAGAVETARRLGVPDLLLRGVNNLASLQRGLGRAEEAVALAREGLVFADGNGLLRNIGTILTGNLAEALTDLGRAAEAEEVLAACELTSLTGTHAEFLDRMRGDLAVLRGDLAGAATVLAQARSANRVGQLQHSMPISRLAVRVAALGGRPLEAREELLAALAEEGRLGHESDVYPLLVEAAAVEADSRGLPEAAAGRAEVLAAIAEAATRLRPRAPLHHGWARLLEGELARAEAADTPAQWAAAVAALRPTGLPYPLAAALLRAGEAEVQAGRREAGTELLREARELATVRGDRPLLAEIAGLADRAGLTLTPAPAARPAAGPAVPPPAGESFGLTPRERDVLRLLARGWTNRQIAEELYISPKTASVHVSNILGKLAVTGRGEAAALAHRLRLFPDDLTPAVR
ncbi:helix-turn-helix transcriptional regulator [Kitasatospora sp. MAA19]|uniref:helix-turn-helix transcriptional regulator n=1 Tax=Kitasatospora sp. MAA19 TaxID=3035090 RepID=UPI0024753699|nr:helix-turn-helix transcriptional regulator [Kitasatospora sp. MAA19]